jgi:hypothetical protein
MRKGQRQLLSGAAAGWEGWRTVTVPWSSMTAEEWRVAASYGRLTVDPDLPAITREIARCG